MSLTTTDERQRYLTELKSMAASHGVAGLAAHVLDDPRFLISSGSHTLTAHHYGEGGLLKHTWEVVILAMRTVHFYLKFHPTIDDKEVFLSALFHDYGKLWDYDHDADSNSWTANRHRRTIHHIPRSAFEWQKVAERYSLDPIFTDRVTHNILSHHGSRACGSPVAPYTREAYIVHLSDCMSARVDDCDRIDLITINKNA